jgi:hypothetical protein
MTTPSAASEEAIHIYAIAIAYLHDAKIDNSGPVTARFAQEVAPGIFHIGGKAQRERAKRGRPIAPVAKCTYDPLAQTWKVELISGETLTLLDKGKFWDIVENEQTLPDMQPAKQADGQATNANSPSANNAQMGHEYM